MIELHLAITCRFIFDHEVELPSVRDCSLDFGNALSGLNFAENHRFGH